MNSYAKDFFFLILLSICKDEEGEIDGRGGDENERKKSDRFIRK